MREAHGHAHSLRPPEVLDPCLTRGFGRGVSSVVVVLLLGRLLGRLVWSRFGLQEPPLVDSGVHQQPASVTDLYSKQERGHGQRHGGASRRDKGTSPPAEQEPDRSDREGRRNSHGKRLSRALMRLEGRLSGPGLESPFVLSTGPERDPSSAQEDSLEQKGKKPDFRRQSVGDDGPGGAPAGPLA